MSWRRANAYLTGVCTGVFIAALVLWVDAWQRDYIGDTRFIGHVSMLALVLGAGGMALGALAAWRADVPTEGEQ